MSWLCINTVYCKKKKKKHNTDILNVNVKKHEKIKWASRDHSSKSKRKPWQHAVYSKLQIYCFFFSHHCTLHVTDELNTEWNATEKTFNAQEESFQIRAYIWFAKVSLLFRLQAKLFNTYSHMMKTWISLDVATKTTEIDVPNEQFW